MKRGTLKNIAAFCRITPQHFSDILGRRKRPSFRLAVALEEYTSVSRVTWVWGQRHELREALEEACREEKIGRDPSACRNQGEVLTLQTSLRP